MQTYHFPRCSRRCCRTGKVLSPGEAYYSAVVAQGGELVRLDYSVEGWEGPPAGAIGWWKARIPTPQEAKAQMTSDEALLEWLEQLGSQPEQAELRYVLALLLVRRRVLKLHEPQGDDPHAQEVLVLSPPGEPQRQLQVPVCWPSPQRAQEIERQLKQLLFPDQEPASSAAAPPNPEA